MSLVDDDQMELSELLRPLVDALDSRDDDWSLRRSFVQPGGVDSDERRIDDVPQLFRRLNEQFLDVSED